MPCSHLEAEPMTPLLSPRYGTRRRYGVVSGMQATFYVEEAFDLTQHTAKPQPKEGRRPNCHRLC